MTALRRRAVGLVVATGLLPITAFGQCGDNDPAVPAPECVDPTTGDASDCSVPGAVRLWPETLRPGLPGVTLPDRRDTTDRIGGLTVPGENTGHELFKSVDVVGSTLYVAYNAGIQAWDISGNRAEDPVRLAFRDGWQDHFVSFPGSSEQLNYVEDIAAVAASGGTDLVAVSGKVPVGISLWEFDGQQFRQLYQGTETSARQVRAATIGGRHYAFAAVDSVQNHDIAVYDLTVASELAEPCCDGSDCEGANACPGGLYLGITSGGEKARYLDILDVGGTVYAAATQGVGDLRIFEFGDPPNPGTALTRYAGNDLPLVFIHGPVLFTHGGSHYLGLVMGIQAKTLEIFDVSDCLDADGCDTLGSAVVSRALRPSGAADEFLTFSLSHSTPFVYYGGAASSLEGPGFEQLLDVSGLPSSVSEVTAGGGTYVDPCNGEVVDYWGRYYPRNDHGLRQLTPRVGKFSGDYFYRAGQTILDVHVSETPVPAAVDDVSLSPSAPDQCATVRLAAVNPIGTAPLSYDWSIPEAAVAQTTSTPFFDWPTDATTPTGGYTAELTVRNGVNPTGQMVSAGFELNAPVPLAIDGLTPSVVDNTVTFTADTEGAAEWTWTFGDGEGATFSTAAEGENPSHTYDALGTYWAELTLSNPCSETPILSSGPIQVEVTSFSLAIDNFRARCSFGVCGFEVGETVTFDLAYTGEPDTFEYDWDGNGTFEQVSAVPVPTHVYLAPLSNFEPRLRIARGPDAVVAVDMNALTLSVTGEPITDIFSDGFESGDISRWSAVP